MIKLFVSQKFWSDFITFMLVFQSTKLESELIGLSFPSFNEDRHPNGYDDCIKEGPNCTDRVAPILKCDLINGNDEANKRRVDKPTCVKLDERILEPNLLTIVIFDRHKLDVVGLWQLKQHLS